MMYKKAYPIYKLSKERVSKLLDEAVENTEELSKDFRDKYDYISYYFRNSRFESDQVPTVKVSVKIALMYILLDRYEPLTSAIGGRLKLERSTLPEILVLISTRDSNRPVIDEDVIRWETLEESLRDVETDWLQLNKHQFHGDEEDYEITHKTLIKGKHGRRRRKA